MRGLLHRPMLFVYCFFAASPKMFSGGFFSLRMPQRHLFAGVALRCSHGLAAEALRGLKLAETAVSSRITTVQLLFDLQAAIDQPVKM